MSRQPRDDFHVWITVDVRWGDMDAYGHVNNARYFTYCESARIRYFEELAAEIALEGLRERAAHGPAVVSATCNFQRQVHYPATLDVGVRAAAIGRSSFTLDYVIRRHGGGEVVADGSSVVVWVDYEAGKAMPLPAALKARILEIDPQDR